MKTQKTTARKDNRTIEQVARSVSAMRRRIGAITRKHNKLQERIARLEKQGRIVNLSHDYEVLAGINCWYVKSDSLNTNPDSNTNYYYETTYNECNGYGCSCEAPHDCKHIRQLGATFAPVAKEEQEKTTLQAIQEIAAAHEQAKVAQIVAQAHEDYQRYVAPLNANRGFQLMR